MERTASPMWSDLLDLVCRRLGVHGDTEEEEAEGWIERLGADLRLVLGWLRGAEERTARRDPKDYLETEEVQDRLRLELGTLPALDLIHALLGAMAETSIARRDVPARPCGGRRLLLHDPQAPAQGLAETRERLYRE